MKKLLTILIVFSTLFANAQLVDRYPAFKYLGTGGLGIHSGTSAQRATGDVRWIRWNSDSLRLEVKIDGSTWRALSFNGEGGGGGSVPAAGIVTSNGTIFGSTTLSSGIAAQLSDETGTGALTFATTPTFTTKITSPKVFGGTTTTDSLILVATSGNATTGADIYFKGGNNGATELMRIMANGNVGINTQSIGSPTQKLTVNGTIQSSGIFQSATGLLNLGLSGGTTHNLQISTGSLFSLNNLFIQGVSSNTGYTIFESSGNTSGACISTYGANHPILFAPNRTIVARIDSTGELLMNTSTNLGSTYKVQINGGLYTNGTLQFRGIQAPTSTYNIFIHGLTDSLTYQISSSVFSKNGSFIYVIDSSFSDISNSGTVETTIDSTNVGANTLMINGQALDFEITGTYSDITASAQLKIYFAGNTLINAGALPISSAPSTFYIKGHIIRTGTTTAKCYAELISGGTSSQPISMNNASLTGLDFTVANVFKFTAQASGAGGGTGDITGTDYRLLFTPTK